MSRSARCALATALLCIFGSVASQAAPNVVSGSMTLSLGGIQPAALNFSGTVSGGITSITSLGPPVDHTGATANGSFFNGPNGTELSAFWSGFTSNWTWGGAFAHWKYVLKFCWHGTGSCSNHATIVTETLNDWGPSGSGPVSRTVMGPSGTLTINAGTFGTAAVTAMGTRGTALTLTGFDNRTASGVGTLQLVSPISVTAPYLGTTTVGIGKVTLVYANAAPVPMFASPWGPALLLGALTSLGMLGIRRMRR